MGNFIDLTGKRFNKLVVIKKDGYSKNGKAIKWLCKCDCGEMKSILGASLKQNKSVSCGCYQKEITSKNMKKHGMSYSDEHRIWAAMKDRCLNPKNMGAKNYSQRGIGICERWQNSFILFYKDMGKRPSKKHSIERVNNNKGYSPSNCKWEVRKRQARNKRSNRIIEINGVKKCLADWLDIYRITRHSFISRVKCGMSIEDALSNKPTPRKKNHLLVTINGVSHTIPEWGKIYNITGSGILYRVKNGWGYKDAITTPSIRPINQNKV